MLTADEGGGRWPVARPSLLPIMSTLSQKMVQLVAGAEQPINDRTQRAGVAVTSGSQSLIFGLADGVVPNCDVAPIEGSVSQAPVAGVTMRNDAALATSPRHRGGATQGAQSMIVSPLQSIW